MKSRESVNDCTNNAEKKILLFNYIKIINIGVIVSVCIHSLNMCDIILIDDNIVMLLS